MKTTPAALRRHADIIAKSDDPDTATALRWAADEIEQLQAQCSARAEWGVKLAQAEVEIEQLRGMLSTTARQALAAAPDMLAALLATEEFHNPNAAAMRRAAIAKATARLGCRGTVPDGSEVGDEA